MNFRNTMGGMPPVTKNLIIINVLMWLVYAFVPNFGDTLISTLGLHFFEAEDFNPIQIFTYMFMHDKTNMLHLFFNMFSLWMFGRILEEVWGSKRYLIFYLVCGIGAAFMQEIVWELSWKHEYISALAEINKLSYEHMADIVNMAISKNDAEFMSAIADMKNSMITIGASGSVFGLLLGFAMTFPNMPLYLFFIPVPIKAKYMVTGYAILEFFLGISGSGTIAHFAHLGGMLFGLIMLLYWKKKGTLHGNGFY